MAFTIEVGSPWVLQECEVDLKYIENIKDFWFYEMPGKRFELLDIILIMLYVFFPSLSDYQAWLPSSFPTPGVLEVELLFPQKALK